MWKLSCIKSQIRESWMTLFTPTCLEGRDNLLEALTIHSITLKVQWNGDEAFHFFSNLVTPCMGDFLRKMWSPI